MLRVCAGCLQEKSDRHYSNNQWNTKAEGVSRCTKCIDDGVPVGGTIRCAECSKRRDRSRYSTNQLMKAPGLRRCDKCVAASVNQTRQRRCAACTRSYDSDGFSTNQWRKGPGTSRCKRCVSKGQSSGDESKSSCARPDPRSTAQIIEKCFAQGANRWVDRGVYTSGPRKGQRCVVKRFKSGSVFADRYFDVDLKTVDRTIKLVNAFNAERVVKGKVHVNKPSVVSFGDGERVLREPFIDNYEKFNSNTGWVALGAGWISAMQALSHFSYHVSGGQFLLCDLQGGVYSDGVILTDPVLMSRDRRFGVTDLGAEGINSFFHGHTCNKYCRTEWCMPRLTRSMYRPHRGSTMERADGRDVTKTYNAGRRKAGASAMAGAGMGAGIWAIEEADEDDYSDEDDYYSDDDGGYYSDDYYY